MSHLHPDPPSRPGGTSRDGVAYPPPQTWPTGRLLSAAARRVEPTLPDRAGEDTDEAWGDTPDSDERILREKPPHW